MIKYKMYIFIKGNDRMSVKISEEQIKGAAAKRPARVDKAVMPGPAYFVALTVTIILLLSFLVAFFAVFANQPSSSNDVETAETGNNITPAKKSNYVSKSAENVQMLGDIVDADNVILVEVGSNESIAEKSADSKIYPASMTKVMSLLVACEKLKNFNTRLTVEKKYIDYAYEVGGSQFGVKKGDVLSTQDLLYLTSYYSDTVAIMMLADHIAGSEEAFVKLMNAKAKAMGLKNTNFDNCTGLFSEDNYTTCREMAAIMAYALENSRCKELLTNINPYKITIDKKPIYTLWSPSWYREKFSSNPRLDTVTVIAGKTGYIPESGYCLVSCAKGTSSGKQYIEVVVGDNKASEDIKYVYNNFAN